MSVNRSPLVKCYGPFLINLPRIVQFCLEQAQMTAMTRNLTKKSARKHLITLNYSEQTFSEEFRSNFHVLIAITIEILMKVKTPKTNSWSYFESRFGFLVNFYPFFELGLKKCGLEQNILNLYPFYSFLGHCAGVQLILYRI
jgi:hypothetical protein